MMNRIFSILPMMIIAIVSQSSFAEEATASSQASSCPSFESLDSGRQSFERYCASCHGKDGQGDKGPAISGSKVATGPIDDHIHFVLTGKSHTGMPTWGLTEISNKVLADIITYQRNDWGNNDKDKYGKDAGGIATEEMIQKQRDTLDKKPSADNIRL